MYKNKYISAVLVGAGNSKRLGKNKIFLMLNGKYVVYYSLEKFIECPLIDEIIIVLRDDDIDKIKLKNNKIKKITQGGNLRQESVYNGIINTNINTDLVVVHDLARPLITVDLIEESIKNAFEFRAAAPGIIPHNTIKKINKNGFVNKTLNRNELREIQTPQSFYKNDYLNSISCLKEEHTDECSLLESNNINVYIFDGNPYNIKITTENDLNYINYLLKENLI